MKYWLIKTEPEAYSWEDLINEGNTVWDGVRNFQALNNMAQMKVGDQVLIYHSGKERRIVGVARITKEAYPDPTGDHAKHVVVELEPIVELQYSITLKDIKELITADLKKALLFNEWALIKQSRLSVMPVSLEQWKEIMNFTSTSI